MSLLEAYENMASLIASKQALTYEIMNLVGVWKSM